jgi:peptide/nickel transport system substrate-binding protein
LKAGRTLVALALLAAAAGCSASAASGGSSSNFLRIGTLDGIESPNPLLGDSGDARAAYGYIYPKLTQDAQAGSGVTGDFATSWNTSDGGKTWIFHTRSGAKWSDGRPLNAHDAAWWFTTLIRYKNGATGLPAFSMGDMTSAAATGDNTLKLTYASPDMLAPSELTTISILPEHVWQAHVGANGASLKTYSNVPSVSGGPFILTKWVKNDTALFKRNPDYYGPAPKISGFGLKVYANEDAMVEALKQHEIDTARIDASSIPAFRGDSAVTVIKQPGLRLDWIMLNTNPVKRGKPELQDPRLGEALSHAINRQQFVNIVFGGAAQPGSTYVSPAMGPYNAAAHIPPDSYDPALADKILDAAGYKGGADGIRMANGHKMSYTVLALSTNNPELSREAALVQQAAAKVGIQLTFKPMDIGAWSSAMAGSDNRWLGWDFAFFSPEAAGNDPAYFDSEFVCSNLASAGGLNISAFCNSKFDALDHEQSGETSQAARVRDFTQMQRLVQSAYPIIVLDYRDMVEVWNKPWTGYVTSSAGSYNERSKWTLLDVH